MLKRVSSNNEVNLPTLIWTPLMNMPIGCLDLDDSNEHKWMKHLIQHMTCHLLCLGTQSHPMGVLEPTNGSVSTLDIQIEFFEVKIDQNLIPLLSQMKTVSYA